MKDAVESPCCHGEFEQLKSGHPGSHRLQDGGHDGGYEPVEKIQFAPDRLKVFRREVESSPPILKNIFRPVPLQNS
jgi:hypothetical protein